MCVKIFIKHVETNQGSNLTAVEPLIATYNNKVDVLLEQMS